MRASRLRLLLVPAALLGLSAILVLARHVRLSTISARVAPAYIEPTPTSMLNGGRIFDAVIRGDWMRDDNVSVWFIGLPHPALRWEWETFHCSFAHGNLASVGNKYHALIDTQQEPYCPVPTAVAKALREGQLRTLALSVFADEGRAEPIVQDVVVKPFARRYHDLAIHTMMKDEAAAIVEWIEYHRLLGVEHFYIYDNNSEDAILARLQGYMDAGVVTYIHWPFRPDKGMHWNQVQNAGLNHMVKSFGAFNRWVGFMDVDEYFQPNASIADALAAGTSTLAKMLDDELAVPRASDRVLCDSLQFQMWQVSCDLGMRDIRDSRHTLLIEKCRQLDPRKLADPDKMRFVGKMFVKMDKVVTMRDIHFLGPSVKRGLSPDKQMTWPEFGRMRHYRAYKEKGLLEFTDGRDDTMDRYIAPLREKIIHYD